MMKVIELPFRVKRPILACGADMKGAFALAKGDKAYLIEGFGDLSDPDNLKKYEDSVLAHEKKLGIRPVTIACDYHPGYFSTKFAEAHGRAILITKCCKVQHHEAHVASAIVEHSLKGDVIGVAFDGTGYGLDSCVWGGEFFTGGLHVLKRVGHFEYAPMPGGEMAVHEPWRMTIAYLYMAAGTNIAKLHPERFWKLHAKDRQLLIKAMDFHIHMPMTSSCGRLFDAAASMILGKRKASFEAELPIDLEKIASEDCALFYPCEIRSERGVYIPKISRVIASIAGEVMKKHDPARISAKFHNTIARVIGRTAAMVRRDSGINKVVLSGGVFQNRFLTAKTVRMLTGYGFDVYTHSVINTNDMGVPIGQLAIANVRDICV